MRLICAWSLVVCSSVRVPVAAVACHVGDTDSSGYTDVTGGSRVCYATGMAVIRAAEDAREQLRTRAATIWNVSRDAVTWTDGRAIPPAGTGNATPLTVAELAAKMTHTGGPV